MLLKGRIRGNGKQLAAYLQNKADNDHEPTVFDIKGTSHPNDLKKSLLEMSLTSELTKTDKGLYHVVINPRPGEDRRMSRKDWIRAAELVEIETGFTGQKRIMLMHEKKGRLHMHVAWERYHHETGKMLSNKNSRYAQNRARIGMEKEFGHLRTPDKNLERPELQKLLSQTWAQYPAGKNFINALDQKGYKVARSENRPALVVINSEGISFDLVRNTREARKKDMQERLKGIRLPNDKDVIAAIRDKQKARAKETAREKRIRELKEEFIQHEKSKAKGKSRGR